MKKKIRSVVLALCLLSATGAMADNARFLVLTQTDGTITNIALSDAPTMTTVNDSLKVKAANQDITVALADVKDYHFNSEQETTGINAVNVESSTTQLTINNGVVTFNGLKKGYRVIIATIDGRVIAENKANAQSLTVDLNNYGRGIYVIKALDRSLKVAIGK